MVRRGQAAMEFLMTYGWAILIVVIAVAALAAFGVFSPSNFAQEKCLADSPTGITCNTKAAVNPTANTIQMAVTNGAGSNVNITDIKTTGKSCTVSSWDLENSTGGSIKYTEIGGGQVFKITVNCNSITGNLFKDTFTVDYTDLDNNLDQHSNIDVIAKVPKA